MATFLQFVMLVTIVVLCLAALRFIIYLYSLWSYDPNKRRARRERFASDFSAAALPLTDNTEGFRRNSSAGVLGVPPSLTNQMPVLVQVHRDSIGGQRIVKYSQAKRSSEPILRLSVVSCAAPSPSSPTAPPYDSCDDLPPPYEEACASAVHQV